MPKVSDIQRAINELMDERFVIDRTIAKLEERKHAKAAKPTRTRKPRPDASLIGVNS